MQLKILNKHGPCRGHPPLKATARDGPEAVSSHRLAVGGWRLSVDGRQLAVSSHRLAIGGWRPRKTTNLRFGSFSRVLEMTTKFLRNFVHFGIGSLPFRTRKLEPGTRNKAPSRFTHSLARDWISHTCSVMPVIKQDRYKERWKDAIELAKRWQAGKAMHYSEP